MVWDAGKVLAAGSEAGGLVLYDLGTCKVLHSAAAIPGLPTASIAQLTWTDGPPPSLNTAYKKVHPSTCLSRAVKLDADPLLPLCAHCADPY